VCVQSSWRKCLSCPGACPRTLDACCTLSCSLAPAVLGPGEIIYIPNNWWHATLNLGESVFISCFV
jgi:hypothetical protein